MSVQAITWAISYSAENSTEKAVLLVLANYADGTGYCFPGQESIAEQAACSERTVRRVLDALEARGIITREERRRRDGSRSSDGIVLQVFRQPANMAGCQKPTGQSVQSNRPSCPSLPDTVSAPTTFEPSGEPSGEPAPSQADLVETIWALQPMTGGKRKATRPDVKRGLDGALKRGGKPAEIVAALRAYYALPDCRKEEGRFARGAEVMLNADRWRDFLLPPTAGRTPTADPAVRAHRLQHFAKTGEWKPTWGDRPPANDHHHHGAAA